MRYPNFFGFLSLEIVLVVYGTFVLKILHIRSAPPYLFVSVLSSRLFLLSLSAIFFKKVGRKSPDLFASARARHFKGFSETAKLKCCSSSSYTRLTTSTALCYTTRGIAKKKFIQSQKRRRCAALRGNGECVGIEF